MSAKNVNVPDDLQHLFPLTPAVFFILFALAEGEKHGYAIMQEIARQSAGQYKIGPGTLYDNLKKLVRQGLVEETASRSTTSDPRRRYYRLKALGRGVLLADVKRLTGVLREARMRLRVLKPRRA